MKIQVIGSADMNSIYNSASYLVDRELLVDIPGGTVQALRRLDIDPMQVNFVLVTHIHGDHTLGLPVWYLAKTKDPTGKRAPGFHVYAHGENLKELQKITYASFPTSFTAEKMASIYTGWHGENTFVCGSLAAERVQVCHGKLPDCCGYVLRKDGKTAGFTGDACLTENIVSMAESCDVLICDCDMETGNDKHMGIDDLMELKKINPSCRIFASHLKDTTRKALLQMQQDLIEIAEDGMVIEA